MGAERQQGSMQSKDVNKSPGINRKTDGCGGGGGTGTSAVQLESLNYFSLFEGSQDESLISTMKLNLP